jgi:exopolyphosphatase/guanosine-5'-triphosphate,3'-diphosphate pyrophosphatase
VAPAVAACAPVEHPTCIIAGGTAGALARLVAARRWPAPPTSLNQFEVGVDSLGELSRSLSTSSLEERLTLPGIDERRADLVPAGSVVLATALEQVGANSAVHSEWGLREGVVLRELGAPIPTSPEQLRRGAVDRLAHAWSTDDGHSAAVRRHADRLFDETRAFHDLGGVERELLGSAARIHDVGTRISPDKHHKHGAYVVEHAGLRGFSPDEVALMACIIRFQRGSPPRASYPPFAALTAGERETCRTLVGILRVGHALGRGGAQDVTAMDIARRNDELEITVEGENPGGAIDDAAEQAPLLERALGCSISFAVRHLG